MNDPRTYIAVSKYRLYAYLSWFAFLSGIISGLAVTVLGSEISQSMKVVLFFLLLILLSNLLAKLAVSYRKLFA